MPCMYKTRVKYLSQEMILENACKKNKGEERQYAVAFKYWHPIVTLDCQGLKDTNS